jgi:hypothetical protein
VFSCPGIVAEIRQKSKMKAGIFLADIIGNLRERLNANPTANAQINPLKNRTE